MNKNSGIYCIRCTITNKKYIGSTYNLYQRKSQHFSLLKHNKHPNIHLQRIYNKYNSLVFELVEECSIDNLIIKEQFYIDNLKPEINIRTKAESNLGCKMSEEAKAKISKKLKGRKLTKEQCKEISLRNSLILKGRRLSESHIEAIRKSRIGTKLSEETKNKIRNKAIGRDIGKVVSKETKDKIRKTLSKKVYKFSIDNILIQEYSSTLEAGKINNINSSSISSCCRNKRKTAGGFKWKYENE